MEIKALATIIEWDAELGRMAIINAGETATVGEVLGAAQVDAGLAEPADAGRKPARAKKAAPDSVEISDEPPAE